MNIMQADPVAPARGEAAAARPKPYVTPRLTVLDVSSETLAGAGIGSDGFSPDETDS